VIVSPFLFASAGGNTVTFTALTNSNSVVRSGTIDIASASGAGATVTVSEAADAESILFRQVRALYERILGRDPDWSGFIFWIGTGAAMLGQMGDSFLTSPGSLQ